MNLLGHALRKAVGLAARELGVSAEAMLEEAGLVLVGHSSLKAALDLDWGQPKAREQALRLVLADVERWKTWLAQHQRLMAEGAPLQDVMDTIAQIVTQDTEPDPDGGPGASASRSRWPQIGASPLRMRTCGTGVRAAPKRSTALRNTSCWTWIVMSRARSWSAPRTSPSMQR